MHTRSLFKGVSIVATALTIVLGGVGIVSPETGLVRVAAQESTATAFTAGQIVQVDADELNVRADASVEAEIITILANGTWATVVDGPVTGGDYAWYQVEYDDETGWVAADFLVDATAAAPLAAGDTVIVNTGALNLRSAAGSATDVIEILEAGTEGAVVAGPETVEDSVWYQIDVDGVEGWVSRAYLALPPASDDAATPVVTGDAI